MNLKEITVFKFIAAALIMFACCGNSLGKRALDQISSEIASKLSAVAANAQFARTNGHIVIKKGSKTFQLAPRDKSGKVTGRPKSTEGPDSTGYVVAVRLGSGKYNEALGRGWGIAVDKSKDKIVKDTDFYFEGAVLQYETLYVVLNFQYGQDANPEEIKSIFHLIKETVTKISGEKPEH